MLNAYIKGRVNDLKPFEEVKTELLLKHGTPKNQLWLIDIDITNDEHGVIFYHENGEMLQHSFFELDNMDTFENACKYISEYF